VFKKIKRIRKVYLEEMLTTPGHKGNEIKTTLRFHLTPIRMATIKTQITIVGEDAGEKRNPHTLLVGTQASTTTLENNMETPQKTKNGTAI
jgi:hypothetical protein